MSKKYYTETLFNNLPVGLPEDVLAHMTVRFKAGDLRLSKMFVEAHTRLATSIGLKYGYSYNRNDEMIGVALLELCKFPQRVANGHLKDDRLIKYLLHRLHNACRDYARNDAVIHVPSSSVVHCGAIKPKREQLENADNEAYSSPFVSIDKNNDTYADIMSVVVSERERLIIELSLKDYNDTEIAKQFGVSPTLIVTIKEHLFRRYRHKVQNKLQTFLPYADFEQSAQCLDMKRLGKQRVECLQLLNQQFRTHPASRMWRGYEYHLAAYGIEVCCEWLDRGYKDTCLEKIVLLQKRYRDNGKPFWLGQDKFHAAHRSNLLRKDPVHYGTFGWSESPDLPYYWPVD